MPAQAALAGLTRFARNIKSVVTLVNLTPQRNFGHLNRCWHDGQCYPACQLSVSVTEGTWGYEAGDTGCFSSA